MDSLQEEAPPVEGIVGLCRYRSALYGDPASRADELFELADALLRTAAVRSRPWSSYRWPPNTGVATARSTSASTTATARSISLGSRPHWPASRSLPRALSQILQRSLSPPHAILIEKVAVEVVALATISTATSMIRKSHHKICARTESLHVSVTNTDREPPPPAASRPQPDPRLMRLEPAPSSRPAPMQTPPSRQIDRKPYSPRPEA